MDSLFGHQNFRNEIVWCYTGPGSPKMRQFNRKHDTIFWYSVSETWTFNGNAVRLPHVDGGPHVGGFVGGTTQGIDADTSEEYGVKGKIPETWWPQEKGNGLAITPRQKKQYVGYPTQKPIALLERIIKASSNEGDVVLDPFCGCATALVASEKLDRQWTGIDISPKAAELVRVRMNRETNLFDQFNPIVRTDIPKRTDVDKLPPYKTHRHMLYGQQEGHCAGCQHHFPFRNLTVDHIVAKSKGGTDHLVNLQLLCAACNSMKGTSSQAVFVARFKRAAAGKTSRSPR